jgi:hypothetical protein
MQEKWTPTKEIKEDMKADREEILAEMEVRIAAEN